MRTAQRSAGLRWAVEKYDSPVWNMISTITDFKFFIIFVSNTDENFDDSKSFKNGEQIRNLKVMFHMFP